MPDKIKRIKCLSSTLRQSPGEEILGWTQGACIIILFAIFERNRRNNSSGNAILQSGKKILIETTNLFRFVVSGWRGGIIVESGLQIKIQNRWKISLGKVQYKEQYPFLFEEVFRWEVTVSIMLGCYQNVFQSH